MSEQASTIDDMIRAAKAVQPDLWKRTEGVARILAPEAFEDNSWVIVEPVSAKQLHEARLKLQRANAMRKAQDILAFLGVNTEPDWYAILTKLSEAGGASEDRQP